MPFPLGSGLLDELKQNFPQIENFPDLAKASTVLEATCREEFYEYLTERFYVSKYSNLYDILPQLNITDIFTTNIDNLIYKIYDKSEQKYINTTVNEGNPYKSGMSVNYSPLHGCVLRPDKKFIFSKTKIASAYTNQSDDWTNLRNYMRNKPILFWGWSFDDADVITALYTGTTSLEQNLYKWILLRNPKDYEIAFYDALGFKIIEGDTESLLRELSNIYICSFLLV